MRKPIAFALMLAGLLCASRVEAGHKFRRGGVPTTTTYPSCYHAAPSGVSAGYSTSGYNDFPFSGGGSYAHPFDRWTWPNMSGAYGQGLARYYDPPVK